MIPKMLPTALALALFPIGSYGPSAPSLAGDWTGQVNGPGAPVALVLHVGAEVRLDSPAAGLFGVLGDLEQTGRHVSMVFATGGSFEGVLKDGRLQGAYSRGPASLPLVLQRHGGWPARLADELGL